MESRKYKVYCHIHPDGRRYVGITRRENLNHRWMRGWGYIHNKYFFRSIRKIGWDNFKHILLAKNLTEEEAYKLEQFFIQKYKSYIRKYGFNLTMGGLCNIPNEETIKKITQNHADCRKEKNSFWGRTHTQQSKKLISQNHDYSKQSGLYNVNAKQVICFETRQLFECASAAAKCFKGSKDSISTACRKWKVYKGLHFLYYNDFLTIMKEQPEKVQEYVHTQSIQNRYKYKYTLQLPTIFDYFYCFDWLYNNKKYSS